ncbi:MAG: hypothetical protein PHV82_08115 [Victivallaceae bacterium]|nr:hypothetical protein [Victivallaceae bacterium]
MSITVRYFTDEEIAEQVKRGETPHEKDVIFESFTDSLDRLSKSERNRMGLVMPEDSPKTAVKKAESYLFSDEVERAVLVKSLVRRLKEQLSGFDQEELGTIVDYLEQLENAVSIAEDELFFQKKCPFVNDCIRFCSDAVHAEKGSALERTFKELVNSDEIIV